MGYFSTGTGYIVWFEGVENWAEKPAQQAASGRLAVVIITQRHYAED